MNTVDDYINGINEAYQPSPFLQVYQEFILNNPDRANEFLNHSAARRAKDVMEQAAKWFENYFPEKDFKKLFIECIKNEHPKRVCELFYSEFHFRKDEFELITHIICYALMTYEKNCPKEIRLDSLDKAIVYLTELNCLKEILHGEKFKTKRPEGSISIKTKYIRQLVKENPELSAKELYSKADKDIINRMNMRTFANQVTSAKNNLISK
jgi:hypothetical protein